MLDLKCFLDLVIKTAEEGRVGASIEMVKEVRRHLDTGGSLFNGVKSESHLVDVMWDRAISNLDSGLDLSVKDQRVNGRIDGDIIA